MYLSSAKSYVYKLVHKTTGQFYYGSRKENVKFNRQAKDDLGICYFSSSKTIKEMGFENFHFEIIGEYDDFDDAYRTEHQLIKESFYHPLNLNKHLVDVENGKKHFCHAKEQSQEAIVKIRERRSTQIISDETRKRMSESHTKRHEILKTKEKRIKVNKFKSYEHMGIDCKENPIIYTWYHIDGTIENCSKFELAKKYKLIVAHLSYMILGKTGFNKGWVLDKDILEVRTIDYRGGGFGRNNPMFDPTVHHWKNIDGREEWLTQYDFRMKYDYAKSNINALVKKREKSFKGWSIVWDS